MGDVRRVMVTKKRDKPAVRRRSGKTSLNPWRRLSEIGKSVSQAERAAQPRDGAKNLKHYLHGSPKEEWASRFCVDTSFHVALFNDSDDLPRVVALSDELWSGPSVELVSQQARQEPA